MQPEVPAVLVGPDRAWMPMGDATNAIALCNARGSCAPIVERRTCTPPECPGGGALVRAERVISRVGEYPEDLEDWTAENESLNTDPLLAPLLGYRGSHPDSSLPPVHWITEEREGVSFELGAHGLFAAITRSGVAMGGDLSIGLRVVGGEDSSYELDSDVDDDLLDSLVGDYFGLDFRLHVLRDTGASAQDPDDEIVAVGVAPYAWNAIGAGRVRVPSLLSATLLEMGGIGGGGHPAAFYFGWNYSVAIQASDEVAFEARASLFIIDGWIEGNGSDALFQIALGGTLR